jgi:hypothetical protein
MNKLCIAFSLFVMLISCNTSKLKENSMKVKVNILGELNNDRFENRKGTFYSLKVDIINNNDSIARFWIMSCSWEDNWISNNSLLQLYNLGCDKNILKLVQLNPRQSITFKGIIWVKESVEITKRNDLRLGFILVKEQDAPNNLTFLEIVDNKAKESKNIIWSEPFEIKK